MEEVFILSGSIHYTTQQLPVQLWMAEEEPSFEGARRALDRSTAYIVQSALERTTR